MNHSSIPGYLKNRTSMLEKCGLFSLPTKHGPLSVFGHMQQLRDLFDPFFQLLLPKGQDMEQHAP